MSVRSLFADCRLKGSDALPRLTRSRTIASMAQTSGKDPSTIARDLDRRAAKRRAANRHPAQSLEFALKYAVDKLGVDHVSAIVGIGRDTLYKALNPNMTDRKLPDIGIGRIVALIGALRDAGHTELFSSFLAQAGARGRAVLRLPSLHHALSAATAAHGRVAHEVVVATLAGDTISDADAARILNALAESMARHRDLETQVRLATHPKSESPS